ncbi:MAG TPA: hypothetical protein DCG75_07945 [Bacteroidales bacterium]|nr:hypothetical protein [Bacteroidales bacterium]
MNSIKQLYIVRHGKSEWDYGEVPDIDRPLKERGIKDAYTMANRILSEGNLPDRILSSPAIRALHTASIFARTFKFPYHEIVIQEAIYMASFNLILDIIKRTENSYNSVMIFGHNPTFTDLANYFLKEKIDNMPTTGIVKLKFETQSWFNINEIKPIESSFDFPKNAYNL